MLGDAILLHMAGVATGYLLLWGALRGGIVYGQDRRHGGCGQHGIGDQIILSGYGFNFSFREFFGQGLKPYLFFSRSKIHVFRPPCFFSLTGIKEPKQNHKPCLVLFFTGHKVHYGKV